MSFSIKTWYDRVVEHAGRKTLTNVDTGEETVVDMTRNDGEVTQAGDAFSAANMNDLETRVSEAFDDVDTTISEVKAITSDAYDDTKAYSAGDYFIKNNTLIKCTADMEAGIYDKSSVEATTVAAEIATNTNNIATNATAISELNENLDTMFQVINITLDSLAISANSYRDLITDVSSYCPDGYSVVGVVGTWTGSSNCAIYSSYISTASSLRCLMSNVSSSSITVTPRVYILYVKSGMV